jgi:hypothetical protein
MTRPEQPIRTVYSGPLVVGQRINMTTVLFNGKVSTASGTFVSTGPDEEDDDGRTYDWFRDGEINGTPQRIFGEPADQVVEADTVFPEFAVGQSVRFRPDFGKPALGELVFQVDELPTRVPGLVGLTIKRSGRRAYRLAWASDLIAAQAL